MNPVALLRAEAGSTPSGTGSYTYFSNFSVVVQNLAFAKLVGIWGHEVGTGAWSFHPCSYGRSLPANEERWEGSIGSPIDQFVVEYAASGNVYWDNNGGYNYSLDAQAAEGTDGVATVVINPNVLASFGGVDAGNLTVDVLVKNIAFTKQVAVVYTTDPEFRS